MKNDLDVMGHLGIPDVINPSKRLMSKVWVCSRCGDIYASNEEMKVPSPCHCGSIFFETRKA